MQPYYIEASLKSQELEGAVTKLELPLLPLLLCEDSTFDFWAKISKHFIMWGRKK
jgi:hypothetical protein